MKVIARTSERLILGMGPQEKVVLDRLLSFYPVGPEREPQLTKGGFEQGDGAQELLKESLREQRDELSLWMRAHLEEGQALKRVANGWRLSLGWADADRLLRILNELRVGAWVRLGCPEEMREDTSTPSSGEAPFFVIMTLAGQFEILLIHALEGGDAAGGPSDETAA